MENKIIKKNKKPLVIVAMILMVALVCGMGAMTYSKYISNTEFNNNTATAAKWGFVVSADAANLFGTEYNSNGEDTVATMAENGTVVVSASGTGDIVAPGTSGYMTISIEGSAEVRAKLTFSVTNVSNIAYGDYAPIVWTLKKGETVVATTDDLAELDDALTVTIEPGQSTNIGDYTLSWEWAFETANGEGNRNVEDSIIGFMSAEVDEDDIIKSLGLDENYEFDTCVTEVSFDLAISVEQIQ